MKKVLAILIVLTLSAACFAGFAEGADTRESVLIIEGTEEKITEQLYESFKGYSIWYSTDTFAIHSGIGYDTVSPIDASIDDVYMTIVPVEIAIEDADALLDEAVGGYDPENAIISDVSERQLESGFSVKSVEVQSEGMINRFYLICGNDKVFCLNAFFPEEAIEGYGVRLEAIVDSFHD